MVHKTALWRTFRLVPVDLLTAPEGWKTIYCSTLGKTWVQVTYIRDAPRFLICMCGCGDSERDVEVCAGEEQAGNEAGARHQKRDCTHEGDAAAGGGILGAWGRHAMESERQRH